MDLSIHLKKIKKKVENYFLILGIKINDIESAMVVPNALDLLRIEDL
jgi:hypothetical protein